MINRILNFCTASLHLGFKQRYSSFELGDRKRIEVLAGERHGRIVAATRQIFVGVHRVQR